MPPTFLTRFSTTTKDDALSTTCLRVDGDDDTIDKNSDGSCLSNNIKMDSGCSHAPQIIDLKGSSWYQLSQVVQEELSCPNSSSTRSSASTSIRLVVPPMSSSIENSNGGTDDGIWSFSSNECVIPITGYRCRLIERHQPHLTTEDFPPLPTFEYDALGLSAILPFLSKVWDNMSLNVYEISRDCYLN